jgi:hypothetical protein
LMAIETCKNPTKKKLIKHARDRKNGDTSRRRLGTVSPGRGVSCACLFPVAFLLPLRGERKKGKKARAAFLTHAVDKCVREMAMQWPECSTRQTADSLVGRQCSPSQGRPLPHAGDRRDRRARYSLRAAGVSSSGRCGAITACSSTIWGVTESSHCTRPPSSLGSTFFFQGSGGIDAREPIQVRQQRSVDYPRMVLLLVLVVVRDCVRLRLCAC